MMARAGMWLYAGRETGCGCTRGERPDVAVCGVRAGMRLYAGESRDVAVCGREPRAAPGVSGV